MLIPKQSSMKIVKEISDVIGQHINMMDSHGVIIASTDAQRIGCLHGGAKKVIDERLDSLTIQHDGEYPGSLQGINLPIQYQNGIIGVIGVTGPAASVSKYGQIIKKMTEILILDIARKEELEAEQRIHSRFLNDWIHSLPKDIDRQMVENGRSLTIDITLPRRVMLVSIIASDPSQASSLQHCIDEAEKRIAKRVLTRQNAIVFKSGSALVCCLPMERDSQMLGLASVLKEEIEANPALKACIGIDDPIQEAERIGVAYQHAQKALRTCLRSPFKDVRLYESINMEIFSGEISDITKLEYVQRIFRGYTLEEIDRWVRLLDTYYASEGSLAKSAQLLYIHKNTLQYRLRQLGEKTGYDPRSIRFSSLYYNAIHFYYDIKDRLPSAREEITAAPSSL